jgi:hypothetical protein
MVLCLSHDGACTDSFENFREISLKGDLSNDVTLNPPLFSLVSTFKLTFCSVLNVIHMVSEFDQALIGYGTDMVLGSRSGLLILIRTQEAHRNVL